MSETTSIRSDPGPTGRSPWLSPRQRDAICLSLLALFCVLLRAPSLDRQVLNPDESQYEATATFLLSTGSSSFAYQLGAPGTFSLFKLLAWIFGPYPMFETRLLLLVLCLGIAVALYAIVRRDTNRAFGLLAGTIFLHQNMIYQGLTVNREWFAVAMIVLGLLLFRLADGSEGRRGFLLSVAAGGVTGFALWFKLQASFMVLVIPIVLVSQARSAPECGRLRRLLVPFAIGGAIAGILYLFPFYLAGGLDRFLAGVGSDWSVFVLGNQDVVQNRAGGMLGLYWRSFYAAQLYRPLFVVGYGFALLVLGANLRRWFRPHSGNESLLYRQDTRLFAVWLSTAMVCVQLGNRFFAHYYLLMLPALAGVIALALAYFAQARSRAVRLFAAVLLVLIVLDRLTRTQFDLLTGFSAQPHEPVLLLYLAAGAAIFVFFLLRPARRAGPALVLWVLLETLNLVVRQQLAPTPASMSHNPYDFTQVTRYLNERSRAGDRLFVWGWAPELYSLSRLESASRVTSVEYVVNDFLAGPPPPSLDPWWAAVMMEDLVARRPRFFVDASARTWTSTEAWIYRLDNYQDFALLAYLERNYAPPVSRGGFRIYERFPDAPGGQTEKR